MFGLEPTLFFLLFFCLFAACAFEFVNGFHDTANAVATVIYTHSLKPTQAVIWSGTMNFLGLLTGGVGVTMSIIGLLPTDLLIDSNVYHSMAMALALLLTAILWNLGTWYLGIPASSSHTLIGSILGIGVGGIWVINSNGNIENGDYIQSSYEIGYGEKQDSEFLANYTVAKATMDCNFELDSPLYECRECGAYIIAFIACTYHCG